MRFGIQRTLTIQLNRKNVGVFNFVETLICDIDDFTLMINAQYKY
jgi:hypothetical protein